ncbi:hypothetical protein AB0H37_03990 [Actinomadura sp. NPDC023710]|uniref:hypothetical protein n=1 Tax=Actinomadura sp. NPDC023710 TaxID=3158219 RepID=UPI0033CAF6DF
MPGEAGGPTYPGPTGHGAPKLGRERRQDESAGPIDVRSEPPGGTGCGTFGLKEASQRSSGSDGYLSAELGVASIVAVDGTSTPEGVKVGAPASEVEKAYPKIRKGPRPSFVTVPGDAEAVSRTSDRTSSRTIASQ